VSEGERARGDESSALLPSDFDSAAALLADAFFDNPAHVYLFPDERQRRASLRWLLRANLVAQAPLVHSFCVGDDSRAGSGRTIVAMGFWQAPASVSVAGPSRVRLGMLAMPIRCGLGAARRVLEISRAVDGAFRTALGATEAWVLNNMAVADHLRGAGLGAELLERELRTLVEPSGLPAVLATQRPENVRFYGRLGFEVVAEETLGSGAHAFPNWIMMRQSNPPHATCSR
jgi:GNAT superfamily N-acetyltransferase